MNAIASGAAPEPRAVDAGRGLSWWTEAWPLFTRAPGLWIVLMLILIAMFIVVGTMPLLGSLVLSLATPVFGGGLMQAAHKVHAGGSLEIADLFAGFRDRLSPLLVLGALLLAGSVVAGAVAALLGLGSLLGLLAGSMGQSPGEVVAALSSGMFAVLAVVTLGLLFGMALWFAPALVMLRGVAPVAALKASFAGCLRNVMPMLVYSVIYLVAAIVASIPFGLGWIVLLPVLLLTVYTSYRDIFGE